MDSSALDMSLDEDTSSIDDVPPKCPLKPQKKNKGLAEHVFFVPVTDLNFTASCSNPLPVPAFIVSA